MGNKGKKKFYAVARGHNTGIFRSWPLCEAQVKGYSGASFKGFATEQEAQNFLRVNGCIDSLKLPDADRTTTKRTTEAASTTERKRPRSADAPTVIIAIQFDGGSRGNPGRAGSGAVVRITQQMSLSTNNTVTTQWQTKTWHARSFVPISATNNEAEYNGVIVGLTITAEELHKLHPNEEEERTFSIEMHIQGDSNLVIQQMRREWKVNKESLKPYFEEAMRLLEKEIQPEECTMLHVYRSDNQLADQLANEAMNTGNSWYTTSDDGHEEPTELSYWMNIDKPLP